MNMKKKDRLNPRRRAKKDDLAKGIELTDAELEQASGGSQRALASDGLNAATSINPGGSLTKHDTVKQSISNVR